MLYTMLMVLCTILIDNQQGQLRYLSIQSYPKTLRDRARRKYERATGLSHPSVMRVDMWCETETTVWNRLLDGDVQYFILQINFFDYE